MHVFVYRIIKKKIILFIYLSNHIAHSSPTEFKNAQYYHKNKHYTNPTKKVNTIHIFTNSIRTSF